jgi:hypothetical protein
MSINGKFGNTMLTVFNIFLSKKYMCATNRESFDLMAPLRGFYPLLKAKEKPI